MRTIVQENDKKKKEEKEKEMKMKRRSILPVPLQGGKVKEQKCFKATL